MKPFVVSEELFVRASSHANRRVTGMLYLLLIFPPLNLLEYGLTTRGIVGMLIILLVALAIIFLFPRFLQRRWGKIYRDNPMYQQEQSVAIDGDEIRFEAANGNSHFALANLKRVEWHEDMVLIWPLSTLYHIVPKAVLDEAEIAKLEAVTR